MSSATWWKLERPNAWSRAVRRARTRVRDDDGQALLEYALILMLVALVTFTTVGAIGTAVEALIAPVLAGL